MIIDIHNHADYHGHSAEKMLENMDKNGIDITCLLSWEAPVQDYDPSTKHAFSVFSEYPVPFERCVSYYEHAPDRFLLGFCPDPRKPDAIGRLKSAASIYNVAMCGEWKLRMMFDNPDAIRMYRVCGELRLPVLLHIDYEIKYSASEYPWPSYWYAGGIEALERALALCPETSFIGHAPGFWAHISGDGKHLTEAYPAGPVMPGGKVPELLDKYPNLYCDISAFSGCNALSRDPVFGKQFITAYQDRIMYARDYFDNIHREFLDNIGLPRDILDKLYYKNAIRILNMSSRPDLMAMLDS